MKIREDFVTNSSSSSFIVNLNGYKNKEELIEKIKNHFSLVKQVFIDDDYEYQEYDKWDVQELEYEKNVLLCRTDMDNFDLYSFVLQIGVDEKDIDLQ